MAPVAGGVLGAPWPLSPGPLGVGVVLTVAKVTAAGVGGYAAYLEGKTLAVEAGDYYLRGGERAEAPGRWALGPGGAAELGVDPARAVDGDAFRSLMAVRHPVSGEALRRVGGSGEAVAAIDATFSAPKSVSAVWALCSPELRDQIEAAQERAVDRALAHAVEFVPMVRRRVNQTTVVRECAGEVLASSWRHTTARAVGGSVPDPQLHSHVVLHGALRDDGRVVAIESRAWLVHQREIGAAYRAQLALELGQLGFRVEAGTGRGNRYFELAGVPDGLRERWSARHHQVREAIEQRLVEKRAALQAEVDAGGAGAAVAAVRLEALDRSGQLMPAEQRKVAMATRSAKNELTTMGDLDRAWWEAAQEHGFDARTVEQLRTRGPIVELDEREVETRIAGRLVEFDATFNAREARAVALEVGAGGSPEHAIAALERLHDRGEVLDLADGRQTTRAHRSLERSAVASAGRVAAGDVAAIPSRLVDREVDALQAGLAAHGAELAAEQEEAVRVACSGRQLVVIVGQAGTGKSTALAGVARAHQAAGRTVIVTSTGGQAAERLAGELAEQGVTTEGYSTAALQAGVKGGSVVLGPLVTVLHDEAALASTREQAWLLGAVAETGACLVEVGDPRQSQAVGAGGLWPEVERAASGRDAYVELQRIVRAKDPADRRDQALWRAGQHERALAGYAQRGRLVLDSEQARVEDLALEAAHAERRAGKSVIVVCQTSNDQLDALNARAQALRVQDRELGETRVPLKGRPYGLHAGDELVLRAPTVHPELGVVRNGTRGRVIDVTEGESARLQLSDGRQGVWARDQLDAGRARLGYVSHSFPAQGQTADRGHVIADRLADAQGTYVALTRAREQTRIYASTQHLDLDPAADAGRGLQVARLAEQLGRSEPEVPSIALPLAHEQHVTAEQARETLSPGPLVPGSPVTPGPALSDALADVGTRPREELARARAEVDRLAMIVETRPQAADIEWAQNQARKRREDAQREGARAEQLAGAWQSMGRFARLGARGQEIKTQLATAQGQQQRASASANDFEGQAADL
ncbi:MAG: MobF family relaxase, partial [Solirubrobacteraceae bacterium]